MKTAQRKMLTIFIDETDTFGDLSLYEAIVRKFVQLNVAGATVMRGIMGFGTHQQVHRRRLFGVSDDRPVSIMVVDTPERVQAALEQVRPMISEGLLLLQDVEVVE